MWLPNKFLADADSWTTYSSSIKLTEGTVSLRGKNVIIFNESSDTSFFLQWSESRTSESRLQGDFLAKKFLFPMEIIALSFHRTYTSFTAVSWNIFLLQMKVKLYSKSILIEPEQGIYECRYEFWSPNEIKFEWAPASLYFRKHNSGVPVFECSTIRKLWAHPLRSVMHVRN
jgi:hypothetical protein